MPIQKLEINLESHSNVYMSYNSIKFDIHTKTILKIICSNSPYPLSNGITNSLVIINL